MNADLDAAKIRRLLLKFSNEPSTVAVKAWLARQTLFHTLRITRAEVAHSGLIAWLLDPGRGHGLGHFGLRKFFEVIALVLSDSNFAKKDSLLPPWLRDASILGTTEFRDVEVVAEQVVTTASGGRGRLDVFVQGTLTTREAPDESKPFRLIIENKIRASEGREQTSLYETWANENPLQDGQRLLDIFVYLTPLPTPQLTALEEPECASKSFIQLNYQYLLEYLIEPFKRQVTDQESAMLLLHYVRNLSHPPISDDEDEKGPMVMAIGTEEKALVRRFWNENKQLLQLVATILADSEGVDETDRDVARAIRAATDGASSKDFSVYDVDWNGARVEDGDAARKTDVPFIAIRAAAKDGALTQLIFDEMRKNKDGAFLLLKQQPEMTENELKYGRYRMKPGSEIHFNGATYFVCKNWGGAGFEQIVAELRRWFPRLLITKHG